MRKLLIALAVLVGLVVAGTWRGDRTAHFISFSWKFELLAGKGKEVGSLTRPQLFLDQSGRKRLWLGGRLLDGNFQQIEGIPSFPSASSQPVFDDQGRFWLFRETPQGVVLEQDGRILGRWQRRSGTTLSRAVWADVQGDQALLVLDQLVLLFDLRAPEGTPEVVYEDKKDVILCAAWSPGRTVFLGSEKGLKAVSLATGAVRELLARGPLGWPGSLCVLDSSSLLVALLHRRATDSKLYRIDPTQESLVWKSDLELPSVWDMGAIPLEPVMRPTGDGGVLALVTQSYEGGGGAVLLQLGPEHLP